MRKEHQMAIAVAQSPATVTRRKPGRKRVRGALEFHPKTGTICWLLGYCEQCHGKVLASREEMEMLAINVTKQRKSPLYKLLRRLLAHYEEQ